MKIYCSIFPKTSVTTKLKKNCSIQKKKPQIWSASNLEAGFCAFMQNSNVKIPKLMAFD